MQFLQHPHRSLYKSAYTSRPSRLAQDAPIIGELGGFIEAANNNKLKDKVQENYDKKITALSDRIKELEAANKSPEDIKKELLKEKAKILQEAINQALIDLKITRKVNGKDEQITYLQIINHPDASIKQKMESVYANFEGKIAGDISKAVDQYVSQKNAASSKATAGLKAVPGLQPFDSSAENTETARLQETLDKRRGIVSKSKGDRAELLINKSESYRARTSIADSMTAPKGGLIDNYETDYKFWSKDVTNENNPTRHRLRGFLYANDIFSGGGAAGQAAMTEAIKEPRKHYLDHWPDKLTAEDLDTGMAMQSYFAEAQKYTAPDFFRAQGTIAGLLRLADKNVPEGEPKHRYIEYLKGKFAELKAPERKDNEEKQLEFLYGIQSLPEFIGADPNWKGAFNAIDTLTDPDAPNAKITDYPGTFSENKNNKTRWNLNGYLYSVYLFNGRNQGAANSEYERAVRMYKASGLIDEDFTQEMIDSNSGDKGFGLKGYLAEASKYSNSEQVKGVIAGLLKQADDSGDAKYRKYLEIKFKGMQPGDTEDAQLMILSSIKSPAEAGKEVQNSLFGSILEASIQASKQHNQVALEKKFKDRFEKDPQTMTINDLNKLAADVKAELDTFVKTRADSALQDMQTKYDKLVQSNADLAKVKGKEPLYSGKEINPVADSIKADALEFTKAKGILKEGALDEAINNKYLATLAGAEKTYFNLVEQLNAMQKAVDEQKESKAPDQNKPLGGGGSAGPSGSSETPTESGDPYKDNWEKGTRVEPVLKDYHGVLVADSTSETDKVLARNHKGEIIAWKGDKSGTIPNGTELMRTEKDAKIPALLVEGLNFVRVHSKDDLEKNGIWIPEAQLYKPENYSKSQTDNPATQKTAEQAAKTAEQAAEKPKFAASSMDAIFSRVEQEVEVNSLGSTFDIVYNGRAVGCRVQKLPDGYHFTFNNEEAGAGDIVFRTFPEIRRYFENGGFYQRLAMQTLLDRKNWDRYKSEDWLDKLVDLKRTGDWTLSVELDWKRNNAFETGNGKIDLSVGPDGRINYVIHKDHVGPAGENERTGFASDLNQLTQAINHAKNWAENYEDNQTGPEFPAQLEHEKALASLMDARTFENLSSQIGEKYYFNNFHSGSYSYMYLNWDKETDLFARNRSLNNPILEVKLDGANQIFWKLINRSGAEGAWVGTTGKARDITDLAYQVEKIKQEPAKAMTKPAAQLPNLGGLGYTLYY